MERIDDSFHELLHAWPFNCIRGIGNKHDISEVATTYVGQTCKLIQSEFYSVINLTAPHVSYTFGLNAMNDHRDE